MVPVTFNCIKEKRGRRDIHNLILDNDTRCSQVLTGMCKYQSTGSNYKIMYFLTSDAKDISNMHLNFQSYWSFLRAMVNLDLHVNMLTPSRVFMRLSLGLEMLTFFKFCFY